ncbi:MAG: DnaJ domain-containing protein [Tepidisphaeraceae bacterium]
MATNCYVVLGIPRDASVNRIRKAFHRFCHEFDPDHTDADIGQFQRVYDAYETLTNPNRRFHHDLALHQSRGDDEPEPQFVTREPVDLMQSFETHSPGREAIAEQFARNVTGRGIPKSQPVRELTVELSISADAAQRGGRLPIDVPIAHLCRRCEGTGSTGFMACEDCDGHGVFWDVARVDVLISPPVQDGTVIPVSLKHLGVHNLYLSVHVRVAPQPRDGA